MVHPRSFSKKNTSTSSRETAFRSKKEERGSNIHHLWVFPKSGQFPSARRRQRRQTFTPSLWKTSSQTPSETRKTENQVRQKNSSNTFRGRERGWDGGEGFTLSKRRTESRQPPSDKRVKMTFSLLFILLCSRQMGGDEQFAFRKEMWWYFRRPDISLTEALAHRWLVFK